MKKIFLVACLALTAGLTALMPETAFAQDTLKNSSSRYLDTTTNTATHDLYVAVRGYQETVTGNVEITKISGTLGGTIVPIVTVDGVNYHPIPAIATADSVTVTNTASQGYNRAFPKGYKGYGFRWIGTGTMSGSWTGNVLHRKPTD